MHLKTFAVTIQKTINAGIKDSSTFDSKWQDIIVNLDGELVKLPK